MASSKRGRLTPSPHQAAPQPSERYPIEPSRSLEGRSPRPRPSLAEPEPPTRPRRSSLKTVNSHVLNNVIVDQVQDQAASRLMPFESPRLPHTPPLPSFLYSSPATREDAIPPRTRSTPPPSSPRNSRRRKPSPVPTSPMPKVGVRLNQDVQPPPQAFPPPRSQQNTYQPPRQSLDVDDSASEYEQEDMTVESPAFSRPLRASSPVTSQPTHFSEPHSGKRLVEQHPSWSPSSPGHRFVAHAPILARSGGFDYLVNNDVRTDPSYDLSSSSTATTTTSTRPQATMRPRGPFHVVNQDPSDDRENSSSGRSATSTRKSSRSATPGFSEPSDDSRPPNDRKRPGMVSPNTNPRTPTMPVPARLGEVETPILIHRARRHVEEPNSREPYPGDVSQEVTPAERLARKTTARWQKSTPIRASSKNESPNILAGSSKVDSKGESNSPTVKSSPLPSNERGIDRFLHNNGPTGNSTSKHARALRVSSPSIAREHIFSTPLNDHQGGRTGDSSLSLQSRSTALSGLVDVLGLGVEPVAQRIEDLNEFSKPTFEQDLDFSEPIFKYDGAESNATSREFGAQYTDTSGDSLRPATTSSSITAHGYERPSDTESSDYVASTHNQNHPLLFDAGMSDSTTTVSSFTGERAYVLPQIQQMAQPALSGEKSQKSNFEQVLGHHDAVFRTLQSYGDDRGASVGGQRSRSNSYRDRSDDKSGMLPRGLEQQERRGMSSQGRQMNVTEPRPAATLEEPSSMSPDDAFSKAGTESHVAIYPTLQTEAYNNFDLPQRRSREYIEDSEGWSDSAKQLLGRVVQKIETTVACEGQDGWAPDPSIPSEASYPHRMLEEHRTGENQHTPSTVPTTWKSTLPNDAYRSLLDKYGSVEMHRQEVIWDICRTEQTFVKTLRTVLRLYVQPLRTKQRKWIPGIPKDITNLFDWLDDILQLHTHISSSLLDVRSAQYPVVLQVAEALRAFVPCLEVHQPYIVRLDATTQVIETMATDPRSDFGEFIRIQATSADAGFGHLSSVLRIPVHRLSEYNTQFRQLWELTPRNHPDYLATFSLLHSTEMATKVMHEVRVREDEYELVKTIAPRVIGLPDGFVLANRGRRLVAQGLLRRIIPSERELSAFVSSPSIPQSALMSPRSPPDSLGSTKFLPFNSPRFAASTASFSNQTQRRPSFGTARPESLTSECSTMDGATSDSRSTTSSIAAMSPSSTDCSLRSLSNASSYTSLDHDHFHPPLRRRSSSKALRAKRDVHVYAFVFTDFVLLTTPISQRPDGQTSHSGETTEAWKVLDEVGLSRVLGVSDVSGRLDAEHLLCVDLLPMSPGTDSDATDPPFATPLYLSLPDRLTSRMALAPAHIMDDARLKWLDAFERCSQHTLRSLCCPLKRTQDASEYVQTGTQLIAGDSVVSMLASGGTLLHSPSQQIHGQGGGDEQERIERSWWSDQYHNIMQEMERSTTKLTLGDGHLGISVQPRRQRVAEPTKRASTFPMPRPLVLSSRAAPSPNLNDRKGSPRPVGRKAC